MSQVNKHHKQRLSRRLIFEAPRDVTAMRKTLKSGSYLDVSFSGAVKTVGDEGENVAEREMLWE